VSAFDADVLDIVASIHSLSLRLRRHTFPSFTILAQPSHSSLIILCSFLVQISKYTTVLIHHGANNISLYHNIARRAVRTSSRSASWRCSRYHRARFRSRRILC
jgi:hypothetical protein